MPFKSSKQRRYLYAVHPEVAKKFAAEEKRRKRKKSGRMVVKKRTGPVRRKY